MADNLQVMVISTQGGQTNSAANAATARTNGGTTGGNVPFAVSMNAASINININVSMNGGTNFNPVGTQAANNNGNFHANNFLNLIQAYGGNTQSNVALLYAITAMLGQQSIQGNPFSTNGTGNPFAPQFNPFSGTPGGFTFNSSTNQLNNLFAQRNQLYAELAITAGRGGNTTQINQQIAQVEAQIQRLLVQQRNGQYGGSRTNLGSQRAQENYVKNAILGTLSNAVGSQGFTQQDIKDALAALKAGKGENWNYLTRAQQDALEKIGINQFNFHNVNRGDTYKHWEKTLTTLDDQFGTMTQLNLDGKPELTGKDIDVLRGTTTTNKTNHKDYVNGLKDKFYEALFGSSSSSGSSGSGSGSGSSTTGNTQEDKIKAAVSTMADAAGEQGFTKDTLVSAHNILRKLGNKSYSDLSNADKAKLRAIGIDETVFNKMKSDTSVRDAWMASVRELVHRYKDILKLNYDGSGTITKHDLNVLAGKATTNRTNKTGMVEADIADFFKGAKTANHEQAARERRDDMLTILDKMKEKAKSNRISKAELEKVRDHIRGDKPLSDSDLEAALEAIGLTRADYDRLDKRVLEKLTHIMVKNYTGIRDNEHTGSTELSDSDIAAFIRGVKNESDNHDTTDIGQFAQAYVLGTDAATGKTNVTKEQVSWIIDRMEEARSSSGDNFYIKKSEIDDATEVLLTKAQQGVSWNNLSSTERDTLENAGVSESIYNKMLDDDDFLYAHIYTFNWIADNHKSVRVLATWNEYDTHISHDDLEELDDMDNAKFKELMEYLHG